MDKLIAIIKLPNGQILEGVPLEEVDYVETEDGNLVEVRQPNPLVPQDLETLKKLFIDTMTYLEDKRITTIASKHGYTNFADVLTPLVDALLLGQQVTDQEAKTLYQWYKIYDDLIWNWIDNTLTKVQSIDELVKLDLKEIEQTLFEESLRQLGVQL